MRPTDPERAVDPSCPAPGQHLPPPERHAQEDNQDGQGASGRGRAGEGAGGTEGGERNGLLVSQKFKPLETVALLNLP